MVNPWQTTSSYKEEPELSEIMSEQLSQRLQIEDDFVWVDLPEVQQVKDLMAPAEPESDDISSDLLSDIESSIAQNDGRIVQSDLPVDINIGDEEDKIEKIYYDEDSDAYETNNWDVMDLVDDRECTIDLERPVNMVKAMYPMSQRLKHKEHGPTKIINRGDGNKNKNTKKVNPLLPKIKFDASTTALLERIIKDRYLQQYNEVIGRGKNSVVFHAPSHRNNCITIPFENAVKVYKLSKNIEKNKNIFKRAQKEFEHLSMVWSHFCYHTIAAPLMAVRSWENVIIMQRADNTYSPPIQDLLLQEDVDTQLCLDIVRFMDICYNVLHLVHGNLCAQNIRYSNKLPRFIGWGHSVKTDHPRALAKLIKDCKFVSEFFSERGVKVKTTENLFMEITRCNQISSKLLQVINGVDLFNTYDRNPNRSCSPVQPNKSLRFK